MVISLHPEFVPTDEKRQEWKEFFRQHFEFPVVIAYWEESQGKTGWTLEGRPRLLRELEGQDISALPWERIPVESSQMPPIAYDRLPPLDET